MLDRNCLTILVSPCKNGYRWRVMSFFQQIATGHAERSHEAKERAREAKQEYLKKTAENKSLTPP